MNAIRLAPNIRSIYIDRVSNSITLPKQLAEDNELTAADIVVLLRLYSEAKPSGMVLVSTAEIARKTGRQQRRVQASIKHMVEHGVIEKRRYYPTEFGLKFQIHYRLKFLPCGKPNPEFGKECEIG